MIQFNECDKADEVKGKKRKEAQVDSVHQEKKVGESLDSDWIYAKQERVI